MRGIVAVAIIMLSAARSAQAGECVAIKKGRSLYASASTDVKVGKATRQVSVHVEERAGAWLRVAIRLIVPYDDEEWASQGSVIAWVRKRDTRRARCPQNATIALAQHIDSSADVVWTDGTDAGSVDDTAISRLVECATDERELAGRTRRCFAWTPRRGLALDVCVDPDEVATNGLGLRRCETKAR